MNYRLTKQRQTILDLVKATCYHPTAEQVFTLAKKSMPSVSKGTVYRNLDVLVAQNLIKRIDIPGEPVRFDGDVSPKAYFVCREKGVIYDLLIDKSKLDKIVNSESVVEFDDRFNLVLFGTSSTSETERFERKGQLINN